MGRIIFVTGTDTGAGKTLLTVLLLTHLRRTGKAARAMKPFCSGALSDVELIDKAQDGELSRSLINPFHFVQPVAPLVAARKAGRRIELSEVLERIRIVESRCEVLLIEGAGGLLAPLGEGYSAADMIDALGCPVVVVARNKLGVINHVLLTAEALRRARANGIKVVLMDAARTSLATRTNQSVLAEILNSIEILRLPYLGRSVTGGSKASLKRIEKKIEKTLARIAEMDTFHTL